MARKFNDGTVVLLVARHSTSNMALFASQLEAIYSLLRPTDCVVCLNASPRAVPAAGTLIMPLLDIDKQSVKSAVTKILELSPSGLVMFCDEQPDEIVREFLLESVRLQRIPVTCIVGDVLCRMYKAVQWGIDSIVIEPHMLQDKLDRAVNVCSGSGIPYHVDNQIYYITPEMKPGTYGPQSFARLLYDVQIGVKYVPPRDIPSMYDGICDMQHMRSILRACRPSIYKQLMLGYEKYLVSLQFYHWESRIKHINNIMSRETHPYGIGLLPKRKPGNNTCEICFESMQDTIIIRESERAWSYFSPASDITNMFHNLIQPNLVCCECIEKNKGVHPFTRTRAIVLPMDDIDRAVDIFGHVVGNIHRPHAAGILYYTIRETINVKTWAKSGDMYDILHNSLMALRATEYCYVSQPIEYYGMSLFKYVTYHSSQLSVIIDDHLKYNNIHPVDKYTYFRDFITIWKIISIERNNHIPDLFEYIKCNSPLFGELSGTPESNIMLRITIERDRNNLHMGIPIPLYDEIY